MANEITVSTSDNLSDKVRRANVRVSPSLLESVKLLIELEDAPYTVESLKKKGENIVNGVSGENFPKGYDKRKEDQKRSEAIELAERFSLKTALIFWDNNFRYNALFSLDNIASVTSHADIETTVDVISKFNKLVSYEKRTFNGKATPNALNIVPHLFEEILPRLKDIKVEERAKTIDKLVKNATDLLKEASNEYRTQTEPLKVQQEKINLLEQYAVSIGLRRLSYRNGYLDYNKIEAIVAGTEELEADSIHMSYGGIRGSDDGDVKIFVNGSKPLSIHVVRGKTKGISRVLLGFGEKYVAPKLQPGSTQYRDTKQALVMLREHFT